MSAINTIEIIRTEDKLQSPSVVYVENAIRLSDISVKRSCLNHSNHCGEQSFTTKWSVTFTRLNFRGSFGGDLYDFLRIATRMINRSVGIDRRREATSVCLTGAFSLGRASLHASWSINDDEVSKSYKNRSLGRIGAPIIVISFDQEKFFYLRGQYRLCTEEVLG